MNQSEIKSTWRKLLLPLLLGLVILITSILFHRLGSKRPGPQTLSMFSGLFGVMLTGFSGFKLYKFKKYLASNEEEKWRFDLEPHTSAGPIKFGMSRDQIVSILGEPEHVTEKHELNHGAVSIPIPAKFSYFESELQISFNDNEQVNFIEFSGRGAQYNQVFFGGIDVFKTSAPMLIKKIQAAGSEYDKEEDEIPYSYTFPTIGLGVWRQVVPEIDENTDEVPESDEGKYFWTIGIGAKGYYSED